MRCDHQIVTEHLMDYLDDKLSPAVRKQVEQAIDQCESCMSTYHQAVAMQQAAFKWQEQEVPEWHRTEYAVRPRQSSGGWLNWTALATSTLAILMVVFQVNIQSSESGFSVAFGGNQSNVQVEALVSKRIEEYQKQQAVLLDARFVAEGEKQSTANKLAMADLLEKTRDERRDDLSFLVTGIQNQRDLDKRRFDRRLTALADNQLENNQYINQLIQSANTSEGDNQ